MKPKKLNLQEITKIYLLLEPALIDEQAEETVLERLDKIVDVVAPEALLECIHILYDNKVRYSNFVEFQALFIAGLHTNEFFLFVGFLRGLDGSPK